uniref:Uncharacterized protein n=1 Tax=Candidatus Methanogaster sp. ANME-2c ERB4 TaxID=2759911 RepID=A0A7G9Y776_9EURY|nr:hypothetical protein AGDLFKPD_00005 [Methanosarcinales archaeon ANME-2c ERB4]
MLWGHAGYLRVPRGWKASESVPGLVTQKVGLYFASQMRKKRDTVSVYRTISTAVPQRFVAALPLPARVEPGPGKSMNGITVMGYPTIRLVA